MVHKYLVIVTGIHGYNYIKAMDSNIVVENILFAEGHVALAVRVTGGEMFDPVFLVETDDEKVPEILEQRFRTWILQGLLVGYRKLEGSIKETIKQSPA